MNTRVLGLFLLLLLLPFALAAERSATNVPVDPRDQFAAPDVLQALVLQPHNPAAAVDRMATPNVQFRARSRPVPSAANRNANPLNIKFGSLTRGYVASGAAAISEITPRDGGYFLKFKSPESGFRAAAQLLKTGPYRTLDLASVFRRWSNSGYGSEILAGTNLTPRAQIDQLGVDELKMLLTAMARAEGYQSRTIAAEIEDALRD